MARLSGRGAWTGARGFDATICRVHGGYSSAAERLTVAQDVVGSIPTSRPNRHAANPCFVESKCLRIQTIIKGLPKPSERFPPLVQATQECARPHGFGRLSRAAGSRTATCKRLLEISILARSFRLLPRRKRCW